MLKNSINVPNPIIDAAINGNLVFFIGSGFSKDFGYPDWKGLVEGILGNLIYEDSGYEPYRTLLKSGKMTVLDVLEQIKNEKRVIGDAIHNTFSYDKSKNHLLEKHKKLFSISKKIITTNYDKLLENATEEDISSFSYNNTHMVAQLPSKNAYIYKIHGDYLEADNCILLKEDYENLYSKDNAALTQFKNIIINNCVVFIGFSMSDPYVTNLFEYINEIFHGYHAKSYIVTVNDDDFSKYNVKRIKLENYDQINLFLDSLSNLAGSNSNLISSIKSQDKKQEVHQELFGQIYKLLADLVLIRTLNPLPLYLRSFESIKKYLNELKLNVPEELVISCKPLFDSYESVNEKVSEEISDKLHNDILSSTADLAESILLEDLKPKVRDTIDFLGVNALCFSDNILFKAQDLLKLMFVCVDDEVEFDKESHENLLILRDELYRMIWEELSKEN
ncbi:SIR2 family protein [Priestia sp. JSM ZJ58]|uniref:SIR2 family protein n=1 Tax=Priestia sp. JSM ZJ58 TaxID=3376189 RepID=UPI0037B6A3D3